MTKLISQERRMAFAYVISGFPRLSETFILHEMLELERQGLALIIFPLKPGQDQARHGEFKLLHAPLVYVPVRFSLHMLRFSLGAMRLFLTKDRARFMRLALRFLSTGKKERDFTLLKSFLRWLWLARQLHERKLANLHAHFAHDPATIAYWCAQLLGVPYSFTAHAKDIYCYSQEWLKEKIHHARFVVTCTDYNRSYLQNVSQNGTPIHCLYHGLSTEKFQPHSLLHPEKPLVLAVGRLVEKKGFSVLLEACALLRKRGLSFACEIIGEGPLRAQLHAQITRLQLHETVRLRGAMTHPQLLARYQAAAMLVTPSYITANGDRDGIPNVILEAMAMSLPVVATNVSGIPEAVDHQTGILVEEKNPRALAEAMEKLLVEPSLAMQLGEAARRKVQTHFDLNVNVRMMKELLLS